jgi:hypothetical protein
LRVCRQLAVRAPSVPVYAGVSEAQEPDGLTRAFEEADEALDFAIRVARVATIAFFPDLGVQHLLIRMGEGSTHSISLASVVWTLRMTVSRSRMSPSASARAMHPPVVAAGSVRPRPGPGTNGEARQIQRIFRHIHVSSALQTSICGHIHCSGAKRAA